MSRHPYESAEHFKEEKIAENYVNFIAMESVPKAMTLDEVKYASREDKNNSEIYTIHKQWQMARNKGHFRQGHRHSRITGVSKHMQ
jgi:hypothetical protein